MTDLIVSRGPVALGKSGLRVGPIAWGMWRFAGVGANHGRRLIEAALDAGVTLFDTADIYGLGGGMFGDAETLLGRILADAPYVRDHMVLATKGGITPPVPYNSSRAYLMSALDASLRRLNVERIELYQIHRPDNLAHPQEVARALEDMVAAGKVAAIGVSNYTVAQTRALVDMLSVPLASHQPEFSPLHLDPIENGLLDLTMTHGIAVLAWSPLGGGRIAAPTDERSHRVAAAIDRIAAAQGVGGAAVAYSWIMAHPARAIPIVGSQNVERVAALVDAFRVEWTRQAWYEVLVASRGARLP